MTFHEFAPAKINLTLAITGRRADGYHLLDSLFVFPDVGDNLTISRGDDLELELRGPMCAGLAECQNDNLVIRAARALQEAAGVRSGAKFVLEKHLPLASGIGGGSADAAAALRGLNKLWGLGWSEAELAGVGAKVGADIPASIYSRPLRVTGVGEVLSPVLNIPDFGILLLNPGVAISTPEVFRQFAGSGKAFQADSLPIPQGREAFIEWLRGNGNMLEASAMTLTAEIGGALSVLEALPDIILSRMSGSGATCFALFPSVEKARAAQAQLRIRDKWWIWAGGLFQKPFSL